MKTGKITLSILVNCWPGQTVNIEWRTQTGVYNRKDGPALSFLPSSSNKLKYYASRNKQVALWRGKRVING